ncbi:MAG: IS1634 family transposase [Candidatus Methanoperedens sp.]|nr:MAG: IS1634 family transposase [Candidatus Methanoperedens sp.]
MAFIRKHLRKGKAYYSVVETFRVGNVVRQRILHYLGSETGYSQFLKQSMNADAFFSSDLENLLYQTPVSLWNLMEEMKLKETFSKYFPKKEWGVDAATAACVMVLNYATDRQSKCRFSDWYGETYLPHLLKIPASKMNKDLLCRTMDCFTEGNIGEIHAEIFKTANEKYQLLDKRIFYDTTAMTFEGKECDLAKHGYNSQHAYKLQVNVALATTEEKFPVMHKVFQGGTKDVSTLEKMMPLLEKTGNLEKTVFIVDRGITSQANVGLIKSKNAQFIFGQPKNISISTTIAALKETMFTKIDDDVSFHETTHEKDRLLIYWSKKLQAENKEFREKRLRKIREQLSKLAKNAGRYEKKQSRLYEKIGKTCGTYRKFFDVKFEKELFFKLKEGIVIKANLTDGRYAILTNTVLAPEEVLKHYRERNFIEMSFKDLKLFVNIGPPRHWKDRRVLAHVFLAILAFGLRSVVELKVRRNRLQITSEEAINQLNKVRALFCKGRVLKLTGQTEEIAKIVSAIES